LIKDKNKYEGVIKKIKYLREKYDGANVTYLFRDEIDYLGEYGFDIIPTIFNLISKVELEDELLEKGEYRTEYSFYVHRIK